MKQSRPLLSYPTLCFSAFFLATTALSLPAYAEFNPASGNTALDPAPIPRLPSTTVLTHDSPATAPSIGAPLVFAPLQPSGVVDLDRPPAYVAPGTAAATANPAYPPVDSATMARAQREMGSAPIVAPPVSQASTAVPSPSGFIAPPPLMSPVKPTPPAAIAYVPQPIVATPPVAVAQPLSTDSKKILSHVPSQIDTPPPAKGSKIALDRVTPKAETLAKETPVDAYSANGISISVHRPGLDTNFELNRAYTALSSGDTETAIQIYKNILNADPYNQDALFGLASTYHRQGQIDKARPLYATLLQHYPNNRDALNNFLVLISDESPQEALAELERLEQRNPDFSPIPAQEALLLNKLGYGPEARAKMIRAIDLAPDNLTYKYNLAIMLDGQGDYTDAASLYRLLIDASNKGATIPASPDALLKRLNYIVTEMTAHQAKG